MSTPTTIRGTGGSASDGLRRLRRLLTALFTAMNAVGLIILAWLFIDQDAQTREQELNLKLRTVTAVVQRLVVQDGDGSPNLEFVPADEIDRQCPQFAVLPGGAGKFPPHYSKQACVPFKGVNLTAHAAEAIRTGTTRSGVVEVRDAGGEPTGQTAAIRVEPFRDGNGQFVGAVAAVADASQSDDAHDLLTLTVIGGGTLLILALVGAGHVISGRAIRPAAAALEQQEGLIADIAHDLRTPVAALRALAETAITNPTMRDDLLPRTVNLAAGMGGIIDGLLVRARLAAGVEQLSIQPVWLDQLVTTVVEETPAEGAQVAVSAAPTKVNADPVLMQRAIRNLLTNALRHGKRPGATAAIVSITVAGGRVVVADQGPGIDPDAARETFDRFSSGEGSTGSGLGLAIVRWVAQAHGGVLRVYNAEEGGAIFELALPHADGAGP
ncbi:HAMP domain-containing histidine kinase [Spirillospora sp. NBC_00431]